MEGEDSTGLLRSPSGTCSQDPISVVSQELHYQPNVLIKSSSIESKSSIHTCSSCGSPKSPTASFVPVDIPALRIRESPSSSSRTPLPSTEPENEYRAFLRQASKAHKRRSFDVRSMMLSCDEVEPHRMPRKHHAHTHSADQTHADTHKHTCHSHSPEHRRTRAPPRAGSVQSDSGVDKLRESLRKKQTMPPSPPRRRLLDRGLTCTCQTPQGLLPADGPSPGPGAYDLEDTFTRSKKTFTISPAPSPRLSNSTSKSPGPGYYSPVLKPNSPAFSIGSSSNITPTKKTVSALIRNETPGPGAYATQSPVHSPRSSYTPSPRASPSPISSYTSPPARTLTRRTSLTDLKPKPPRNSPSPSPSPSLKLENGKPRSRSLFSPPKPTKRLLLAEEDERVS